MHAMLLRTARFPVILLIFAIISKPANGDVIARPPRDLREGDQEPRLCLTPECVDTAARMRQFIDPSVDPCEDFYQFACGRWMKGQVGASYSTPSFEDIDQKLATIKIYLEGEPEPANLNSIVKTKDMYASCVTYAPQKKHTQKLKDFIKKKFGVWPLTTAEWDGSKFDVESSVSTALKFGITTLLSIREFVYLIEDEAGMSFLHYNLSMAPPLLPLPALLEKDQNILQEVYKNKIFSMASKFGVENEARAKQDIEDILEFESTLLNMTLEAREANGDDNTSLSLTDLEEACRQSLDWRKIIQMLLSSPDVGINDLADERVLIFAPGYFTQLAEYLPQVKKRTLANYIIWRVVYELDNVLIPPHKKMKYLVREMLENERPDIPAERRCIEYVSQAFDLVLHRLMYAEHFPEEEMHRVKVMTHKIHNVFDDRLEEMDWLDVHTKTVILEKRRVIETVFLHFDRVMNDTFLDSFYSNLKVDRDDFFNNHLSVQKNAVSRGLRHLGLPPHPLKLEMTGLPWDIAAYIVPMENIIRFSASIFEPPFFTYNVPQSLNYGGIGVVLGHELTHAFDNNGYRFSHEGVAGEWWSEETVSKFIKRQECMVEQYSNFYFSEAGDYVKGNYTLGENMADNGGLGQSFQAYRSWICSRGEEEETLPSLPYDNNQLFFINYAHLWCSVLKEDTAKQMLAYDPHSPPQFRIIGPLQNSKEFAEAFNCPAGSYMNPIEKCKVW